MTVYECDVCGGEIISQKDSEYVTCDYCGYKQKIHNNHKTPPPSKTTAPNNKTENNSEQKLYDEATKLMRNQCYRRAVSLFKQVSHFGNSSECIQECNYQINNRIKSSSVKNKVKAALVVFALTFISIVLGTVLIKDWGYTFLILPVLLAGFIGIIICLIVVKGHAYECPKCGYISPKKLNECPNCNSHAPSWNTINKSNK